MERQEQSTALTDIVSAAVRLPGVKVDRKEFLLVQFKDTDEDQRRMIIEDGPVKAGCTQRKLRDMANRVLRDRTLTSTTASFAAGLPGGLAMAATIPADLLQFYAVSLRLAQEVAYLYGEPDLWQDGVINDDKVRNQLILYCGVMFGANGAAQGLKVMASALAKQAMKKLPQQALTKTFVYSIVKSTCKFFGVKMTKSIFAKGVSKAIPLVGGVLSGGITFASMKSMGARLIDTLEEAHFHYTEEEFRQDWETIVEVCEAEEDGQEGVGPAEDDQKQMNAEQSGSVAEEIQKAQGLLDAGIITPAEFAAIKERLIARL